MSSGTPNNSETNAVPKKYDPKAIEDQWYDYWMKHRFFEASEDSGKEPFTIMMPPPNVTGALHMGHALQGAVQDTLTRLKRMQGYEALWLPGTDHAGIATQNVVERELKEKEKKTRHDIGREEFVNKVWEWKEKYGEIITRQYSKLGVSCDWSRERFTMDEGLSRAVQETFIRLHDEGLIYKGNYLVNWCPVDMTAISDEEVEHVERKGHMWHVSYPLDEETAAKSGKTHLTIATTRPETIPADTAVSVHPEDDRYKNMIGGHAFVPTTGRKVPIIADEYVKTEYGSGALKVTPAHDENDFEIGLRHNLPRINIINKDGTMNEDSGRYNGMDRFDARDAIVKDIESEGLLEKVEDYVNQIGISSRSKAVIEPLLSDQWFVKMKPLADKAMQFSRDGEFRFYPPRWQNEFFRWMENIRDWVISRQLWWGHRIPVWYHTKEDGSIDYSKDYVVSIEQPDSSMVQDPDVLDTWFSSWLWPFSTLGWPDKTRALDYFYPTSVLVSGYDILFFWVSRMLMGGIHFTGETPFRDIFMTGIVKDKLGRKMSKSLNNGIDPLEMIDQYGADAVRYCLIILCAQGQDIKLDPSKFEMGRNFANKLWNAFRFLNLHLDPQASYRRHFSAGEDEADSGAAEISEMPLQDRWMITRINQTIQDVDDDLSRYRLNEALLKIYSLVWDDFCDWYLELIKPEYGQSMPHETAERAIIILEMQLKLLHPFMPFITEEIWQRLRSRTPEDALIVSDWPVADSKWTDGNSRDLFITIQQMISSVRNIRAEMNVPDNLDIELIIKPADRETREKLLEHQAIFEKMLKISEFTVDTEVNRPGASASDVVDGHELFVPLSGLIDFDKEKQRVQKEISRLESFLTSVEKKLANEKFLNNAPADVVENEKKKQSDARVNLAKMRTILADLDR
ncbi:valine--tRNA ligase [Natronogracilivirga saccharolytica]|uniref:Valine--tRNA ligase n=1 Tax=Natronogracilivirga saccharolytica TaxID=2812953 RepID=A0A8J7RRB3_9BACT|nr:valine--tRNA ligase [Natronogracilivirga saccharolytica]MBP3192494.1 valine--tRNA ligase [Natronogracilivirga saccharolytica]